METPEGLFALQKENMINTVQELIDALEKVKDKSLPVRAFFDPGEYEASEQAEISMISCIDDSMEGHRVDINLFQFPAFNG